MSWLPVSLAKRRKAPMGSDPVERTKTRGVTLFMSSNSSCKWTAGLSTNGWPRFSRTKSVTANTVCGQNGRHLLYEINIVSHTKRSFFFSFVSPVNITEAIKSGTVAVKSLRRFPSRTPFPQKYSFQFQHSDAAVTLSKKGRVCMCVCVWGGGGGEGWREQIVSL